MKHYYYVLTIILLGFCGLRISAQPAGVQQLMDEARSYSKQKEYSKSNECYESVIANLKGTEYESLIPSIKDFVAINYMSMGVAALKEKNYAVAKSYMQQAIDDAKPGSKTCYTANLWMGRLHSTQAMNIRTTHGDIQQAVGLSLEAEKYFDLAQATDRRLEEQVSRASALIDLSRPGEAEVLLRQVVNECEGNPKLVHLQGKAAYYLGETEMGAEKFQLAIQHLEQAYNQCKGASVDALKAYARLAANRLGQLYKTSIPDTAKADLWKKRAEELN